MNLNIVIVGDPTVGKTTLLQKYLDGNYKQDYDMTLYIDVYKAREFVDSSTLVNLVLLDTAGQEEFKHIRKLSYETADCFLLCYAVDNKESLVNLENVWMAELKEQQKHKNIPILMCGMKTDLRESEPRKEALRVEGKTLVDESQGREVAERLALNYVECSAMQDAEGEQTFKASVTAAIKAAAQEAHIYSQRKVCKIILLLYSRLSLIILIRTTTKTDEGTKRKKKRRCFTEQQNLYNVFAHHTFFCKCVINKLKKKKKQTKLERKSKNTEQCCTVA